MTASHRMNGYEKVLPSLPGWNMAWDSTSACGLLQWKAG